MNAVELQPIEANMTIKLPKQTRTLIAPLNGWKESQYYVVHVATTSDNVVHRSIFFSGVLHKGKPADYNAVFNPAYEGHFTINDFHYFKVIRELDVN